MIFSRKYKGSAPFLRGLGSAAQQHVPADAPDAADDGGFGDLDVLNLLPRLSEATAENVAGELSADLTEVSRCLESLRNEGFIMPQTKGDQTIYAPTETGMRALKYARMAKF